MVQIENSIAEWTQKTINPVEVIFIWGLSFQITTKLLRSQLDLWPQGLL